MGISTNAVKTLLLAKKEGTAFDKVLTLGRQLMFMDPKDIAAHAALFGEGETVRGLTFTDGYAEPLFTALGATVTDSMDFSDYEGATVIHDLNVPVPPSLYNQYDVVFDGGTLEHVFNFPQAVKNCMQMVKQGGHFLAVTPANNQLGHGFYQFSPELFFRVFSEENGFAIVNIFVSAHTGKPGWYKVKDPNEVRSRVTLTNGAETDMMIIARRIAIRDIFNQTPQQSDYATIWQDDKEVKSGSKVSEPDAVVGLYQKIVPASLRAKLWRLRYNIKNRQTHSEDLGRFNPKHFIKTGY